MPNVSATCGCRCLIIGTQSAQLDQCAAKRDLTADIRLIPPNAKGNCDDLNVLRSSLNPQDASHAPPHVVIMTGNQRLCMFWTNSGTRNSPWLPHTSTTGANMLRCPPTKECVGTRDLALRTCPPTVGAQNRDPMGTPRITTPCCAAGNWVSPLQTTTSGHFDVVEVSQHLLPINWMASKKPNVHPNEKSIGMKGSPCAGSPGCCPCPPRDTLKEPWRWRLGR